MDNVVVRWQEISADVLVRPEGAPRADLYAIGRGADLFYVGKVQNGNVAAEVKNTLREFGAEPGTCLVWLGEITKSSSGPTTERLVTDVACALIYTHQAHWNRDCKSCYTGEDVIRVTNEGCPLLDPEVLAG